MVRLIHKSTIITTALALLAMPLLTLVNVSAVTCTDGETEDGTLCDSKNTTLLVNVAEVLTVSLSKPSTWASGNVGELLRNKITLSVISNNPSGYTASMYTNNTNLVNKSASSSAIIPTLASATTHGTFTTNSWGYSIEDTVDGSDSANYYAMTTSSNPIKVLEDGDNVDDEIDVYFGAKADATKDSGTYAQTVIFSVVSGVIDAEDNPAVPENPVTPGTSDEVAYTEGGDEPYYGNSSTGATRYTTRSTSGTGTSSVSGAVSTTTTEVTSGNTTASYSTPQGVTTTSKSSGDNLLPAILVGTAAVAAISGGVFLAASRRKDEDEE